jgi:hypothetical protein
VSEDIFIHWLTWYQLALSVALNHLTKNELQVITRNYQAMYSKNDNESGGLDVLDRSA